MEAARLPSEFRSSWSRTAGAWQGRLAACWNLDRTCRIPEDWKATQLLGSIYNPSVLGLELCVGTPEFYLLGTVMSERKENISDESRISLCRFLQGYIIIERDVPEVVYSLGQTKQNIREFTITRRFYKTCISRFSIHHQIIFRNYS